MAHKKVLRSPKPRKDIVGKNYGYWLVLRFCGHSKWLCRCKCGTERVVAGVHLKSGHSKSCGCFKREASSRRFSAQLEGRRFGKLTVLSRINKVFKDYNARWRCRCDCGRKTILPSHRLTSGHTKSCGCLSVATHGKSKTRTYRIWVKIWQRCTNKNDPVTWANYGGRGISVCERWEKFENFLEDMGEAPPNTSIERIHFNGNYEPGNCRWATSKEQARNTRRNKFVIVDGETMLLTDAIQKLRDESFSKEDNRGELIKV